VNVSSSGQEGNADYFDQLYYSITGDGRFVVFSSAASNLVPGDTNHRSDVFIHDCFVGTTERLSVTLGGNQGDGDSLGGEITPDGRYVAFTTLATNLVPGDTNGHADVLVLDRQRVTFERASLSSRGTQGEWDSGEYYPRISSDGRFVAFESQATTLVSGDTDNMQDIFVRDRQGAPSFTIGCAPGADGVIACPCSNPPRDERRGCDNSSRTGGASLSASGGTYLSSDSFVLETSGEGSAASSIVLQGTTELVRGARYGQGVRCVGGAMKRLYTKRPRFGSIVVPDFDVGDPTVSSRSATLGDRILPGQSRWYMVVYRDPIVLGGCSSQSTFNVTPTGQVFWAP
jgi:hypothetical protein